MEGLVALIFILFLIIVIASTNGESKEDLRNKIKQLEQKLNGNEFRNLLFQTSREVERMKRDAEKDAKEIRAKGREYVSNLTNRKMNELNEQQKLLNQKISIFESDKKYLLDRNAFLEGLYKSFQTSYINGRNWLADFYIEAISMKDGAIVDALKTKKNPAIKAAEKLSEVQRERREILRKYKLLEYQLLTYEEYFPFLVDYKNEILNDEITGELELENSNSDPINKFISAEEYANLTPTEKNQLALDRYLQGSLSNSDIGKMYERYLGFLYEKQGYEIQFIGIEKGFEDLGRDLICSKGNEVIVIQAKCWASSKEIRERHIFQLFSTTLLHKMENSNRNVKYTSILYTTTKLSDLARDIADKLKVKYVEFFPLDKSYPMIKCNIGKKGDKIYHLPFDQMYDKVVIDSQEDECYATTIAEAEAKGFRRAFKWKGLQKS